MEKMLNTNEISSAKLVSYSSPSQEFSNLKNIQELVAYCARVSNPQNQFNSETSEKLLKYLIEHQHWSPLEMVSACLEITTTRDIARQMLRHRSFSFQEFSQRYADPVDNLNFVIRDARLQDNKNRQNSITLGDSQADKDLQQQWAAKQQLIIHEAKMAYRWAIINGIAKEQARAVLPEGNTVSKLYMNGTLRSWIHYIQLRASHGTQLEHIMIARECAHAIYRIFPMIGSLVQL